MYSSHSAGSFKVGSMFPLPSRPCDRVRTLRSAVRVWISAKTYPSSHHRHHQAQAERFSNESYLHSSHVVTPVKRESRDNRMQRHKHPSQLSACWDSISSTRQPLRRLRNSLGLAALLGLDGMCSLLLVSGHLVSAPLRVLSMVALACLLPSHRIAKHITSIGNKG